MKNWIEQLIPIIDEYKDGDTTPLNGDSVDDLCHILKIKINLQEGNLTQEEYESMLDLSVKDIEAFQNASHLLCDDDIEEAVNIIKVQADLDDNMPLDNVEGILVWSKVVDKFTVGEFLEEIYR